ncbi:MAG: GIY-YIG nuclease family protein [Patescibacteria group bacterium]|nr:GIY-YIG nuclease family protein [Patescibacteria group bacterium]
MFYVYILQSQKNNQLYIGRTDDLRRRFSEHNQGLNTSTKPFVPWKLIYYEACLNRSDSIRREKYLKSSQGTRLIKRRLKNYLYPFKVV